MVEYLNNLYQKEITENQIMREWVDLMADFIASEIYHITYVDRKQWNGVKKRIVKDICMKGE